MKICIVAPTFYPIIGGTEMVIKKIGSYLVNLGHEVQIVTRKLEGMNKTESLDGMRISRVFTLNNPLGVLPLQISLYNKLRRIIKNYDIIHQFHVYHMGFATLRAVKKFKKPFMLHLAGNDTYDPIRPIPKFLNPYMSWVMNNADIVISPSMNLRNHAVNQGLKKKNIIIPSGVDINRYHPKNDGMKIREKLEFDDIDIMVLSMQRLDARKKLECLLKAAKIVVKKHQNVNFVIGGKGTEYDKLKKLSKILGLESYVKFVGFIPDSELPYYYAACDIFALHTTYEAFGIVLAEAMASGKPVVSTKVGAIPEVVEHGKTGLLVPPMNEKALAESVLKFVENQELREKMGGRGREKAVKKYNWDNIVKEYLCIYNKLIR